MLIGFALGLLFGVGTGVMVAALGGETGRRR